MNADRNLKSYNAIEPDLSRQKKQVCGSEGMVVGMGCHTVALCAG